MAKTMATRKGTTKKKTAKGGPPRPVPDSSHYLKGTQLGSSGKAPKKKETLHNGVPVETGNSRAQRMLVSDAFPERDQNVENLLVEFRQAEASASAEIAKAEDRKAVAQKALKAAVRALGIDKYSSYESDDVIELKHLDDKLKVRKRKPKEAMPTAAK